MSGLRRDRPADVRYRVGATGSGKTWRTARDIAAAMRAGWRVLVWDWKDDHYGLPTARSLAELLARMRAGELTLRYCPRYSEVEAQFDLFCRIAWELQRADTSRELLFVVEELPEVTTAARPPEVWRRILNQGRVLGLSIVATTQAPALVDKSFTGAATEISAGRLGELRHAQTIGQRLNIDPAELQRLGDGDAYILERGARDARLELRGQKTARRKRARG